MPAVLRDCGSMYMATWTWETLAVAEGDATFEKRVDALLNLRADQWNVLLDALQKAQEKVPAAVDRDRAAVALLPLLDFSDGDAAADRMLQRLASVRDGGPTATLDWQCGSVAAAGSLES